MNFLYSEEKGKVKVRVVEDTGWHYVTDEQKATSKLLEYGIMVLCNHPHAYHPATWEIV